MPDFTQPVGKPKAYLQLIVYDKHEKYVRQERRPVTVGAGVCEELALSKKKTIPIIRLNTQLPV